MRPEIPDDLCEAINEDLESRFRSSSVKNLARKTVSGGKLGGVPPRRANRVQELLASKSRSYSEDSRFGTAQFKSIHHVQNTKPLPPSRARRILLCIR
jgi:hypothetical protein